MYDFIIVYLNSVCEINWILNLKVCVGNNFIKLMYGLIVVVKIEVRFIIILILWIFYLVFVLENVWYFVEYFYFNIIYRLYIFKFVL